MATTMVIAVKCLHPSRLHFLAIDILSPWKVQFQIAKGCYTLLHTHTHTPSPITTCLSCDSHCISLPLQILRYSRNSKDVEQEYNNINTV